MRYKLKLSYRSRDKFAVHEGSKPLLDRRSRFTFAVYGELRSTDNSDEPKRANHLPVSLKLGPNLEIQFQNYDY